MFNFLRVFFVALFMLQACLVQASTQSNALDKGSALGVALEKLSVLQGFSADFEQVLTYAEGGKRVYLGQLAVLRPGKFRWHYVKPYEQLYVSNGDGIWLYEPDLLQAQKLQDLGDVDPIVMQLLDGRVSLDDVQVLQHESFDDGLSSWHVRIGRKEQQVEVWLGVKAQQLIWIESRDMLSNRNRLHLQHMKQIPPAAEIFEFTAPEGVDVIGAIE
ncbi:LolA family protein [Ghiorsea bivora]|uniref:LolA family protein n=1 Tax=Ghiorsea bivora TaxID=1485545 RepID=UPI000571D43F|nr:outer-membrane lipoprotein carrier protein LolA [Ghiorsea bivora]